MSSISFEARMAGEGTHRCTLQRIETDGDRPRWVFVTDAGEEIIRRTGTSWRIDSANHRLAEQLTGREFSAGDSFDPESLMGRDFVAHVSGSGESFSVRFEPGSEVKS
ncbi:MAG: hypothetical protein RIK87_23495 [Fuerstiella sp.]